MRLLRTNVFQRISLFCKQGQFQPLIICRNFVLPSDMALSNFTPQIFSLTPDFYVAPLSLCMPPDLSADSFFLLIKNKDT